MYFPRQSPRTPVIFLKAMLNTKRPIFLFIWLGDSVLKGIFFVFYVLSEVPQLTYPLIHHVLVLSLFPPPPHFALFSVLSSPFSLARPPSLRISSHFSCRVTYSPAWMRLYWPAPKLWLPWTSQCPRARRTLSNRTPPTTPWTACHALPTPRCH